MSEIPPRSEPAPAARAIAEGRIYDVWPVATYRVLVDRLWPRGVRREGAPWELWLKEAAPSGALRVWYHARPDAYETFRGRYREELRAGPAAEILARLAALAAERPLALVTARADVARSHVPILAEAVRECVASARERQPDAD